MSYVKWGLGERIRIDAPRQCVAAGASREARALNLSSKHFSAYDAKNWGVSLVKPDFQSLVNISQCEIGAVG